MKKSINPYVLPPNKHFQTVNTVFEDDDAYLNLNKKLKYPEYAMKQAIFELRINVHDVYGKWELYPMKYWMDVNPKRAVPCVWKHEDNFVYVCLQLENGAILRHLVAGNNEKKDDCSFQTQNLTTRDDLGPSLLPKELSNDVLWFSEPSEEW